MTVQALLKFEGVDGTQVFTDETGNQTWANEGTGSVAELDNAEFIAGSSSLKVDAGSRVTGTLNTQLTGEFTVEGWFYVDPSCTGTVALMELEQTAPYAIQVTYNCTSDYINLYSYYGGSVTISQARTKKGEWFHVCMIRNADGKFDGRVNGYRDGNTLIGPSTATQATGLEVHVGDSNSAQNPNFIGWCDSVRVIDENIYPGMLAGLPEQDPGLTYTIYENEIEFLEDMFEPSIDYQLIPAINGQDLAASVEFLDYRDEPDEINIGITGVQIWG
jgi:hypothetical protein